MLEAFLTRRADLAMASDDPTMAPDSALVAQRRVVHRTSGTSHGPITRLFSPGDLGQLLKPFVFLDHIDLPPGSQMEMAGFGMHPHSGIATLTYLVQGHVRYEDTTGDHGERGVLRPGGVEWMMAGGGVWHQGAPADGGRGLGFQLWVAMPPELELARAYSRYVDPEDVPRVGPARVLLGSHAGQTSPIPAPSDITYLGVHLRAGETWRFEPAVGHTVAWAALAEGQLHAPDAMQAGELLVFESGGGPIAFEAKADAVLVLGSAARHPYGLHMGSYSVHTSTQALRIGQQGIRDQAASLRRQGRL